MDSTGSGTSAPSCASVRSCRGTTSGTSLGPRATKDTPQATGGRGPKKSQSLPGRRRSVTPQHAHGGHHPECVPPLAHTEAPYDRSPRGEARAVLTPRGWRRAHRNSARDKEPWPIPSPQPHAASRGTNSRLPWGQGQGPRGPLHPPHRTDTIYHRSPMLVQEVPHRAGAQLHHSHASRARATGSASRGPPPGGRRSVQLIHRLPPRVSGRPAVGGTTRHGHAAKGACGRPKACAQDGGRAPPTAPKPPRHGGHIPTTGAQHERPKGGRRNGRDLLPSGVR